jgi:hypothetical protein
MWDSDPEDQIHQMELLLGLASTALSVRRLEPGR